MTRGSACAQAIIPIIINSYLALLVFAVSPRHLDTRLGIVVTLFLSLTALQVGVVALPACLLPICGAAAACLPFHLLMLTAPLAPAPLTPTVHRRRGAALVIHRGAHSAAGHRLLLYPGRHWRVFHPHVPDYHLPKAPRALAQDQVRGQKSARLGPHEPLTDPQRGAACAGRHAPSL